MIIKDNWEKEKVDWKDTIMCKFPDFFLRMHHTRLGTEPGFFLQIKITMRWQHDTNTPINLLYDEKTHYGLKKGL